MQQVAGDGPGEALLRTNLAGLLVRRGALAEAHEEATRAVGLAAADREPAVAAGAYRQLGRVLLALDRRDEACGALAAAIELYGRGNARDDEVATRIERGRALLDGGDARHAIAELSHAITGRDAVVALQLLAEAYEKIEQPKNALTFRDRAIAAARGSGNVELRRALLDSAIAAAARLGRDDLVAEWRNERSTLDEPR